MTDFELIDWLSTHPVQSYLTGSGGNLEWVVVGGACIGYGPDFRTAAKALIENDRARAGGIPCIHERNGER
jgi:hypothetical protein